MPVKSIKIVPTFPDSLRKAVTGAGGRMLGQKQAFQQVGQMARYSNQADLANRKMGLERQKLSMMRSKLGHQNMGKLVTEFNKFNINRQKENAKREEYGKERLPDISFNQYLQQFYGIAGGNPLTGEFETEDNYSSAPTGGANVLQAGMESVAQPSVQGALNPMLQMARNFAISQIPVQNRGAKIRGYAEGGVITNPQLAMVGEQGKEYIVPENKLNPQQKAELEKLLSQVPNPEKVVSDRLPTLEQLTQTLEEYDTAEEAITDLIALDQSLGEAGMDLMDVKGIEQFLQAFVAKFGQQAADQLVAMANDTRGGTNAVR